jgi:amino acid transporter
LQQQTSPDGADNTVKRTRVPLFSAFFMIYIFVSGGSFGIEEMVSSSGPGLTLILLLAFPFIWALPMALIASELGSAMPHSGGFYVWTRRGLGQFWGFQAAWWWSLALLVDTSLYIVLSATYLQHQIGFSDTVYYVICWSIIALFTAINLMGIRVVAIGSSLFAILIISPILVLAFVGIANWQFNPFIPITPPDTDLLGTDGALILGLSVGLWMYSGYESMSTLAGEIEEPQRIIPKALMLALPFVALMYLLPTAASIAAFGIGSCSRSTAAAARFLLWILVVHWEALLWVMRCWRRQCSVIWRFISTIWLQGARPIQSLARDGLLPPMLASTSSRFGTPVMAILLIAGVNAILVIGPFQSLVIIDVLLMVSSYALIFIAAVRLRITEPDLVRPFKIPGGKIAMILLVLPPMALIVLMVTITLGDHSLMLWDHDRFSLLGLEIGWYGLAGLVAILSGPLLYPLLSKQ